MFATADRVTTDLNLAMILRGRFTPTRMTVTRPKVLVRFGPGGEPLTKLRPVQQGGTFPVVIVETAQLTLAQTGRPAMVIENLLGRFGPDGRGLTFAARANDRDWGLLEATGGFSSDFTAGMLVLKTGSAGLSVTQEKVLAIPFVPSPRGPRSWPTCTVPSRVGWPSMLAWPSAAGRTALGGEPRRRRPAPRSPSTTTLRAEPR